MLELEKKHLNSYLKDKKEIKKTDTIINENKIAFYKIFNYLVNEYYKNFKKEFLDSEIIKNCNVEDVILTEIKEFLKDKNLASCRNNKIIINYKTINFLTSLIHEYKNFCLINPINILTFIMSMLAIIFSFVDKSILQWLAPITIMIFLFLLNSIMHNTIDKINKK